MPSATGAISGIIEIIAIAAAHAVAVAADPRGIAVERAVMALAASRAVKDARVMSSTASPGVPTRRAPSRLATTHHAPRRGRPIPYAMGPALNRDGRRANAVSAAAARAVEGRGL